MALRHILTVGVAMATIVGFVLCSSPQNPYDNIDNAELSATTTSPGDSVRRVGDTMTVTIEFELSHFFDSVTVTFGDYWDTTVAIAQRGLESRQVTHTLDSLGTSSVGVIGYLTDGNTLSATTIDVEVRGIPPRIATQPSSESSSLIGDTVTLAASATGTGPLAYSWLKNGTDFGAEKDTLSFEGIAFDDSGTYRCVVSSQWGSDTTDAALVAVAGLSPSVQRDLPPVITVIENQPCTLSIAAEGTGSLDHVWYHDGDTINYPHRDTLIKTKTALGDSGQYRCVVTSPWGSDTSLSTKLIVYPQGTPPAPTNLIASRKEDAFIKLTWSSVDSIDSYKVYRDTAAPASVDAGGLRASLGDTSYIDSRGQADEYHYWVTAVRGGVESPWSNILVVTRDTIPDTTTDTTTAAISWLAKNMEMHTAEGDSATVCLRDSVSADGADITFLVLNAPANGVIVDDTCYRFTAGHLDSGSHVDSIVVTDGLHQDTLVMAVNVEATYCTLSVAAEGGTVTASPNQTVFRWGDTVTVSATPKSSYAFSMWEGDAQGTEDMTTLVMNGNRSVTAKFTLTTACKPLDPGTSINQEIKQASAARPRQLCPQAGLYEEGTVKVYGKVKVLLL